jgi:ABC-2 type transport system permease protein
MSEIALPNSGTVLASQLRYQLILLARNPRAIAAGLILPGALLALERGSAQHITMAQAAPKIAGLVALSAVAIAFFTHANGLVVAREEGVLRRWHASPLPSWAYFAGRMMATMAVTAAAGLILVLVAVGMTGVHLNAHAIVGLLVVDMLAALALAAAGTAITTIIPSAQSAQPVLMLTYIPLIVLGGAFGAITSLPHWVSTAMTYLAVLAGWVAGGLLVSFRFLAWHPPPPGARTARGGTHHAPFGQIKRQKRRGPVRSSGGPATRLPPGHRAARPLRRGARKAPRRRPGGRVSARSARPRC